MKKNGVKFYRYLFLLLSMVFAACFMTACGKEDEKLTDKKELSFSEIEKLAEDCVFNVNWHTADGDFSAGTSFIIDSPKHGQKLLVTAFHYFVPDNVSSFNGSLLQDYVKGGDLYYAKSGKDSAVKIKNNIVIIDAAPVPDIAHDAAAFTLKNGEKLSCLKLSDRRPEKGEKIYLLARLWDGEVINENCVYECEVVRAGEDEIKYTLDKKYGTTMGASGAPLVDKYGEVVGMHMAGNSAYYFGHSTESFVPQIEYGFVSDVTY